MKYHIFICEFLIYLATLDLVGGGGQISRWLNHHGTLAGENVVRHAALLKAQFAHAVVLTVVDHCGHRQTCVEVAIFIRRDADLWQAIYMRPGLPAGLGVGHHVVVHLQVG